jgi:hypothetical protein
MLTSNILIKGKKNIYERMKYNTVGINLGKLLVRQPTIAKATTNFKKYLRLK